MPDRLQLWSAWWRCSVYWKQQGLDSTCGLVPHEMVTLTNTQHTPPPPPRSVTGFPVGRSQVLSSYSCARKNTPHAHGFCLLLAAGDDSCEPIVRLSAARPFPVLGPPLSRSARTDPSLPPSLPAPFPLPSHHLTTISSPSSARHSVRISRFSLSLVALLVCLSALAFALAITSSFGTF